MSRAAEKQASRDADARALASGEKSRAQLKAENGAFAFPRDRIRLERKQYKNTYAHREHQREVRRRNREAGRCINENAAGTHGPATHGCRCSECYRVHRLSA